MAGADFNRVATETEREGHLTQIEAGVTRQQHRGGVRSFGKSEVAGRSQEEFLNRLN